MYLLQISVVLFSWAVSQATENETPKCEQSDRTLVYLDVASDMIAKAKLHYPNNSIITQNKTPNPMDCADILRNGYDKNGVYTIWPKSRVTDDKPLDVFCDMDTDGGGWTVLQRRGDFNKSNDYFFKDWASYKSGFGDIKEDFWIGNDNMFALTNQRLYSIRFDLEDSKGAKRYALHGTFWIDDENNKYTLNILDYSGDAGNSMGDHHKRKFSTKDQDNDGYKDGSCAQKYKGGWWYSSCLASNLNGLYLKEKHELSGIGLYWSGWTVTNDSLKATEMKIRPKNFKKKSF
ncbi:unnamed protein product [Larinioides sclopetarius]|uniref:Fibrinogen C-terminal domain-containing protein n=1 Tax=Larinioides sclopetarius TaxID=280406 RepID=A0AAV2A7B3_9ARAC